MKNYYLIFSTTVFCWLLLVNSFTPAYAQEQIIKGVVTSAQETNGPLPFVTVAVKESQKGVNTDAEGRYVISASAGQTLVFSFIGYQSSEVIVGNQTEINVKLQQLANNLSEVLVTGYGKQSRELLSTSISKLDTKVLENIPYANAASALQGTIAGVRVQTTSGQPGAAPRVIVRGGTSIDNPNGASPLYIIDGVIRGDMNFVNADDIETLQVLKDAAATSIYGARGSNGVVIITTKTGKAGKIQITYRYSLTASQVAKKLSLMPAKDWLTFARKGVLASAEKQPDLLSLLNASGPTGIKNDLTKNTIATTQYLTAANEYKLKEGWESIPDPADPSKTIIFKNTDFQDHLFRTGLSHNHYLNASGGTENASFNMSVGYLKSQGIAITTDFDRFTAALNGDLKLRKNLRARGQLNFNTSSNKQVYNDTYIFARSISIPPVVKYTFEDGTLAPGSSISLGNPEYHLNNAWANNKSNTITLGSGLTWDITPDLKFEPSASLYLVQGSTNSFTKSYYNGPSYVNTRDATGSYSRYSQTQFDGVFSYNKKAGGHHFDAMAGASYYGAQNYALSAAGRGATTDKIPTLNASAQLVSMSSTISENNLVGFWGSLNYNYEQKYLVTINSRYDGASRLGKNNKWGLFPGFSAGWNVHNESFWDPSFALTKIVSKLKLRASYGINGNLGTLGNYQAQGVYAVGGLYNGGGVITNNTMPNQNLKWEQTKVLDFGFDMGLLNNRINILFDIYNKRTDGLLTSVSLPQSTGFISVLTNFGSLQNKGKEIEVSAVVLQTPSGLTWNLGLNASWNSPKIIRLPDNANENNRVGGDYVFDPKIGDYAWKGGLQQGGKVGDYYAYKQLSIYATNEEAAKAPTDMIIPLANKTKYGGDVNWQDVDANGIINDRDRVYVGNMYPKASGGMSSTVSYLGLSLYVRMDYTVGHTIYNYYRAYMIGQFQGDNGLSTEVYNSWQKQGDVTDVPRYYWADQAAQNNLFRGNSRYYEKGDFLAIRELSLSYTLPAKIASYLKLKNVHMNFTANNLKYFTKYKGLNPEEGGQDNGRYPIPRNFIVGISATL